MMHSAIELRDGKGRAMAELLAGAASVDVTPPVGLWHLGVRSERIRDDLRATAVVLAVGAERVAIVNADTVSLNRESVARIRQQIAAAAGIPPGAAMVIATHTHSSPVAHPLGNSYPDADYVRRLEGAMAEAAVKAAQSLLPATLSYGEGYVGFGVNRRLRTPKGVVMQPNPEGVIDRRVRVWRIDAAGEADAPLAVLFSVCCHPTSFPTSPATNADYPGAARRVIERAYGGETRALFLPGAFGNVRPNPNDGQGRFRSVTDLELERMGRVLGAEVVRVAEEVSGIPREPGVVTPTWNGAGGLAVGHQDVPLRYRSRPSREQLEASTSAFEETWRKELLATLDREGRLPDGEDCEVQVMRLGPFLLVAIAGEPFVETGRAIEERLLGRAGAAAVLVAGYANGNAGYLCTAEAYAEGGYEAATAHVNYHRPGPYIDTTESLLVETATSLATALR
jgi:neutral ceramidase